MTDTKTVSTERLANALAELTDCFLEKHGCFPIDNKRWNAAMTEAYALVGQPGTHTRTDKLSTFTAHTQPPAEWQVEAAARVLVPVWYGGFEDQTQKEEGGWLHPPGTPNKRALDTARDVLRAASIPAPEHSMIMPLNEKGLLAAARAVYETLPNFGMERRPNTAGGYEVVRVDDTWEDAPNRHDECTRQAEAAVRAYLSTLETPSLHKEGEAVGWFVEFSSGFKYLIVGREQPTNFSGPDGDSIVTMKPVYTAPVPVTITDELRHAFRHVDGSDWKHLFAALPDTHRGRFWKAVMTEARAALSAKPTELNTVKENNNASQVD